MAKKTIIDNVEGSNIWGYVAMGAGLLAVVGVVIVAKEVVDAKRAARNLEVAQAELEAVKEGSEASEEVVVAEEVENFEGRKVMETPVKGFVSSWRPLRMTYQPRQ